MSAGRPTVACPTCGGRLEAGVCKRCRVAVETSPVVVFETSDQPALLIAKSILEGARIPFLVQGDESLGLFPLGDFGRGPFRHGLAAMIRVLPERAEEAMALLEEWPPGPPAGDDEDDEDDG